MGPGKKKKILWILKVDESVQPHLEKDSGFLPLHAEMTENISGFVKWNQENILPFFSLPTSDGGEAKELPGGSSTWLFHFLFYSWWTDRQIPWSGFH